MEESDGPVDPVRLGIELSQLRRHADALASFDKALEIDPRNLNAWVQRGYELSELGRHTEAVAAFDRALELDPRMASAWAGRGYVLIHLGRHVEALACYDRALEIDPRSADAWAHRGYALNELRRDAEALESCDKALEIDSQGTEVAWMNRGVALDRLGCYTEALASWDRALEMNPRDPIAWINRASTLGILRRHEDSLASSDQALKIDPRICDAWVSRGVTLTALGRPGEALRSYDRALEIDPQSSIALYDRGFALYLLARYSEALEAYERALKVDPRSTVAWINRGHLLFSHPGLTDEQTDEAGRSLERAAWLLHCRPQGENIEFTHNLIGALDEFCNAPLLIRGLMETLGAVPDRIGKPSRLQMLERETQLSTALLDWVDDPSTGFEESDRERLKGRIYLAFGDPARALINLQGISATADPSPADCLYLAWAMHECIEPTDVWFASCEQLATRVVGSSDVAADELYYAGHLFMLMDKFGAASEAFKRAGDWAPALAMLWVCANKMADAETANAALDSLLAIELRWFQQGVHRSLLFPHVMPPIDPRTSQGKKDLQWTLHVFETSDAATELLESLDELAGSSRNAAALLARIDRSGADPFAAFEERRRAWTAVDDFAAQMKAGRRAVTSAKVEHLKQTLRIEYELLGLTPRDALAGAALTDHLEARLYQTDLAAASERIGEAIVLLYLEKRLAPRPTALLALYALAKRQHDLDRHTPHKQLAMKALMAGALATPLHLFGVDTVVAGFAAYAGVDMAEWVAEQVLAWRSRSGSSLSDHFPAFDRFVEQLHQHWVEGGRPDLMRALLSSDEATE